jgi:hypothetical protein
LVSANGTGPGAGDTLLPPATPVDSAVVESAPPAGGPVPLPAPASPVPPICVVPNSAKDRRWRPRWSRLLVVSLSVIITIPTIFGVHNYVTMRNAAIDSANSVSAADSNNGSSAPAAETVIPVTPKLGAKKIPTGRRLPASYGLSHRDEQAILSAFELRESARRDRLPAASLKIDELVQARLKAGNITQSPICSDAVFLRRAYLDLIGRIPTADEAEEFLSSKNPNRRMELIDDLLGHRDFADYWSMKWCDLLRVKSEFPINLWPNSVQAYHLWIRNALRENMPYDQFARTLLTASGSNFRDPPANFYRAVQKKNAPNIARAVALTFMGVRSDGWPAERWEGMETFFSQIGYKKTDEWKEEIVFFDMNRLPKSQTGVFPDGSTVPLQADKDPRQLFADWLITPNNPWFTRNIANRTWSWFMGRGIIHEVDDIHPDSVPSNPELLAFLQQELVQAKYDLRQLFRVIMNSNTYQASSIPASDNPEASALFAYYPVRRLEAEVIIDAICQVTGTTEQYSSPIPEPFTYIPETHRSVRLADASITSSFLEMFGRSPRDTGLESERNNNFTAAQRLHMLNSAHILKKIEQGPGLQKVIAAGGKPREVVDRLYLTILSRHPTEDELNAMDDYTYGGGGMKPGLAVAWALINSAEFFCRH